MNSAGGFLFDGGGGQSAQAGPSNSTRLDRTQEENDLDSLAVRKLTSKQEARLMNYLDEAFLQINRGFSKRHNSDSSSVPTLSSFLKAYDSILVIIASIPPIGPSASLLVSYLLRFTNELLDGIVGYEINVPEQNNNGMGSNVSIDEQLQLVVQSLGVLDRVWSCVLRGQMVDLEAVKKNVEAIRQDFNNYFPLQDAEYEEGQNDHGGHLTDLQTSGRFPPIQPSNKVREGRSIVGSKGYSTVAQTNRIRLRNVITLAKENLFSWMRVQLDVPLPPRVGEDDEEEENEEDGDQKPVLEPDEIKVNGNKTATSTDEKDDNATDAHEEGEDDLEEVDTDRKSLEMNEVVVEARSSERSHFDDIFSRKIDPDALDSDSDSDSEETQSHHNKHSRPNSQSPAPTTKFQRKELELSPPTSSHLPDTESIATFSGTAAVMKWDLKFARLFAQTLRCLSDIQEQVNQREAKKTGDNAGEDV